MARSPRESVDASVLGDEDLAPRANTVTDGQVVIVNALGLHARAAAKLVNLAKAFTCSIELCVGEKSVDAKSIMKVMMLAAGQGTVLTLRTNGEEEKDAFEAISALIGDRFGEEQ